MEQTKQNSLLTRIVALVSAIALAFSMIAPVTAAHAASVDPATLKNTITINEASSGDQFKVWKVVDITYDQTSNSLTYAWNADFADYFGATGKNLDVRDFAAMDDASEISNLFNEMPSYIHTKGLIDPIGGTYTVADGSNSITTSILDMGGYFIEPISAGNVYQPMFVGLVPSVDNATDSYKVDPSTINAKKSAVAVTKDVQNTYGTTSAKVSASIVSTDDSDFSSRLSYTISANLPNYANFEQLPSDNLVVLISDDLPEGITLDTATMKVYGTDGTTSTELTEGIHYTYSTTATGFEINLSGDAYKTIKGLNDIAVNTIKIEYQATLNDDATISNVGEPNKNSVAMTYNSYPYLEASEANGNLKTTDEATANVFTYGIKIFKKSNSITPEALAGAKFVLYRDAADGETPDKTFTVDGQSKDVVAVNDTTYETADGTTDLEKGYAVISGLRGDISYYLEEVAAPTGYAKLNQPVKVDLDSAQIGADGYVTVDVPNTSENLVLPLTGDTGTVLFVAIGLLLMSAAALLLLRKRAAKQPTDSHGNHAKR